MIAVRNNQCPVGPMGEVWDVAEAALYLASPASRYVTAAELVVDGGITATMMSGRRCPSRQRPATASACRWPSGRPSVCSPSLPSTLHAISRQSGRQDTHACEGELDATADTVCGEGKLDSPVELVGNEIADHAGAVARLGRGSHWRLRSVPVVRHPLTSADDRRG